MKQCLIPQDTYPYGTVDSDLMSFYGILQRIFILQIVHIENTVEDQVSKVQSSDSVTVVRV